MGYTGNHYPREQAGNQYPTANNGAQAGSGGAGGSASGLKRHASVSASSLQSRITKRQRAIVAGNVLRPYHLEPPPTVPPLSSRLQPGNVRQQPHPGIFFDPITEHEVRLEPSTIKKGYATPLKVEKESLSMHEAIYNELYDQRILKYLNKKAAMACQLQSVEGLVTDQTVPRMPTQLVQPEDKRELWLRNVANPEIPLSVLANMLPYCERGERLLDKLCSNRTPPSRALWVIKLVGISEMLAQHNRNVSHVELKMLSEKYSEHWTQTFMSFLEKRLSQLSVLVRDRAGPTLPGPQATKLAQSRVEWHHEWQFLTKLAHLQYDSGLLDQRRFLLMTMSMLGKANVEQLVLLLPFLRDYVSEISKSRTPLRNLIKVLRDKIRWVKPYKRGPLARIKVDLCRLFLHVFSSAFDAFFGPTDWNAYRAELEYSMDIAKDAGIPLDLYRISSLLQQVDYRNRMHCDCTLPQDPLHLEAEGEPTRHVFDILTHASPTADLGSIIDSLFPDFESDSRQIRNGTLPESVAVTFRAMFLWCMSPGPLSQPMRAHKPLLVSQLLRLWAQSVDDLVGASSGQVEDGNASVGSKGGREPGQETAATDSGSLDAIGRLLRGKWEVSARSLANDAFICFLDDFPLPTTNFESVWMVCVLAEQLTSVDCFEPVRYVWRLISRGDFEEDRVDSSRTKRHYVYLRHLNLDNDIAKEQSQILFKKYLKSLQGSDARRYFAAPLPGCTDTVDLGYVSDLDGDHQRLVASIKVGITRLLPFLVAYMSAEPARKARQAADAQGASSREGHALQQAMGVTTRLGAATRDGASSTVVADRDLFGMDIDDRDWPEDDFDRWLENDEDRQPGQRDLISAFNSNLNNTEITVRSGSFFSDTQAAELPTGSSMYSPTSPTPPTISAPGMLAHHHSDNSTQGTLVMPSQAADGSGTPPTPASLTNVQLTSRMAGLPRLDEMITPHLDSHDDFIALGRDIDADTAAMLSLGSRTVVHQAVGDWLMRLVKSYVVKDVKIGLSNWRVMARPGDSLLNSRQTVTIIRVLELSCMFPQMLDFLMWLLEHTRELEVMREAVLALRRFRIVWALLGRTEQVCDALVAKQRLWATQGKCEAFIVECLMAISYGFRNNEHLAAGPRKCLDEALSLCRKWREQHLPIAFPMDRQATSSVPLLEEMKKLPLCGQLSGDTVPFDNSDGTWPVESLFEQFSQALWMSLQGHNEHRQQDAAAIHYSYQAKLEWHMQQIRSMFGKLETTAANAALQYFADAGLPLVKRHFYIDMYARYVRWLAVCCGVIESPMDLDRSSIESVHAVIEYVRHSAGNIQSSVDIDLATQRLVDGIGEWARALIIRGCMDLNSLICLLADMMESSLTVLDLSIVVAILQRSAVWNDYRVRLPSPSPRFDHHQQLGRGDQTAQDTLNNGPGLDQQQAVALSWEECLQSRPSFSESAFKLLFRAATAGVSLRDVMGHDLETAWRRALVNVARMPWLQAWIDTSYESILHGLYVKTVRPCLTDQSQLAAARRQTLQVWLALLEPMHPDVVSFSAMTSVEVVYRCQSSIQFFLEDPSRPRRQRCLYTVDSLLTFSRCVLDQAESRAAAAVMTPTPTNHNTSAQFAVTFAEMFDSLGAPQVESIGWILRRLGPDTTRPLLAAVSKTLSLGRDHRIGTPSEQASETSSTPPGGNGIVWALSSSLGVTLSRTNSDPEAQLEAMQADIARATSTSILLSSLVTSSAKRDDDDGSYKSVLAGDPGSSSSVSIATRPPNPNLVSTPGPTGASAAPQSTMQQNPSTTSTTAASELPTNNAELAKCAESLLAQLHRVVTALSPDPYNILFGPNSESKPLLSHAPPGPQQQQQQQQQEEGYVPSEQHDITTTVAEAEIEASTTAPLSIYSLTRTDLSWLQARLQCKLHLLASFLPEIRRHPDELKVAEWMLLCLALCLSPLSQHLACGPASQWGIRLFDVLLDIASSLSDCLPRSTRRAMFPLLRKFTPYVSRLLPENDVKMVLRLLPFETSGVYCSDLNLPLLQSFAPPAISASLTNPWIWIEGLEYTELNSPSTTAHLSAGGTSNCQANWQEIERALVHSQGEGRLSQQADSATIRPRILPHLYPSLPSFKTPVVQTPIPWLAFGGQRRRMSMETRSDTRQAMWSLAVTTTAATASDGVPPSSSIMTVDNPSLRFRNSR